VTVEELTVTSFKVNGVKVILSPTNQQCYCRGLHCEHMVSLLSHLGFDSLSDYLSVGIASQKKPTRVRGVCID
jgi:hypothetical protein